MGPGPRAWWPVAQGVSTARSGRCGAAGGEVINQMRGIFFRRAGAAAVHDRHVLTARGAACRAQLVGGDGEVAWASAEASGHNRLGERTAASGPPARRFPYN